MTTFSQLKLHRWRQFEHIDLDLSSRLTVLTGPNGCGKTTVLNLLGRHFGWNLSFLKSPLLSNRQKRRIYADAWDATEENTGNNVEIGNLGYQDGTIAKILSLVSDTASSGVTIKDQQPVAGLHIPSHRPPPGYSRLKQIPIDPKTAQQHYQSYQNILFQSYGEHPQRNPAVAMKEALIGFAVFGQGNASVVPNAEYAQILRGFEEALSQLLPAHIGFQSIEVETPEVLLKTRSGRFPLEAMSGGLNAVVGIAWQIHMHEMKHKSCTVLIDEPENHLHPSIQRDFLPRLTTAFPNHSFIVATHSPFVVCSAPSAVVYGFPYSEERRVVSRRLTEVDLAASPSRILREVLDVPVTTPKWVEERIRSVLDQFKGQAFNNETIARLRETLRAAGLEQAFGEFISEPIAGEDS